MPSFSTLASAAALAALAAAQSSSPTPTSTGNGAIETDALPILYPFGATIGGSAVSSNSDGIVFAITCLDKSGCPQPSTASYTAGKSMFAFGYPNNDWACPISGDMVTCTLHSSAATTTTVYPRSVVAPDALPTTDGIAQAVIISGGPPPGVSSTGSSSGSGSGSGSSKPTATGSSSGGMMPSSSASGSSSASSPSASSSGNAAEHMVAGTGLLGAAALLVGAVIA